MGDVKTTRPTPKPVPLPYTPLRPLGEEAESSERGKLLTIALIAAAVIGALFLALGDSSADQKDAEQKYAPRVHSAIDVWAKELHVGIDGVSCRYGSVSECDVHQTDGTREHLRCDKTGCATRDAR